MANLEKIKKQLEHSGADGCTGDQIVEHSPWQVEINGDKHYFLNYEEVEGDFSNCKNTVASDAILTGEGLLIDGELLKFKSGNVARTVNKYEAILLIDCEGTAWAMWCMTLQLQDLSEFENIG